MIIAACGSPQHQRFEARFCDTCGFDTVHLLTYSDSGWWGTGVLCSSCGEETGEAGLTPPAEELLDDQVARIGVICAQVDEVACACPMEFWEGELEGGFMYAPCVHELAVSPMDRELYMWMIGHLGGIVKIRLVREAEARGAAFDAFPDGTILNDYIRGVRAGGVSISMAAMKVDGRWETQGAVVPECVRDEFVAGRLWARSAAAGVGV